MISRKDMLRIPCGRIELQLKRHSTENKLPDMLFMHGFMGNGRAFSRLITELSNTVNAITLDIRAAGDESTLWAEEPLFAPGALSAALQQIPHDLFYSQPFIYAYSMGGRVALHEAVSQTRLFKQARALLLESTTAGIEDAQQRKQRREDDNARAHALLTDFERFVMDWQHQPLFRGGNMGVVDADGDNPDSAKAGKEHVARQSLQAENKALREDYAELQRRIEPNEAFRWLLDFGTGSMPSLWNQLQKIVPPVLLITGEHDQRFTQTARRMQPYLHHSAHVIIPAASHRVHADKPKQLAFEIAKFINNPEPGSPPTS